MLNILWIIISIFVVVFLYYGIPYCYASNSRAWLKRSVIKHNALVLTFDDGPGRRLTPQVLRILEENNTKATFFFLGQKIAGKEDLVRKVVAKGHEIGSHGYEHLNSWKVCPLRSVTNIIKGWNAIDDALGQKRGKYIFRPAYGKLNLVSLVYLLIRKVPIVYWTVDCGDTWPMGKRDNQRASSLTQKVRGAVTLAHDNDRLYPDTESMVLASLKSTLIMARKNHMQLLTVSQLMACDKDK